MGQSWRAPRGHHAEGAGQVTLSNSSNPGAKLLQAALPLHLKFQLLIFNSMWLGVLFMLISENVFLILLFPNSNFNVDTRIHVRFPMLLKADKVKLLPSFQNSVCDNKNCSALLS